MKNLLSLICFCLATYFSFAQSTDYYDRMNLPIAIGIGAIDGTPSQSKVTIGLLKEFGVRLNHVENYAGSMNTTNFVDVTQWQSLYHSLSKTANTNFIQPSLTYTGLSLS